MSIRLEDAIKEVPPGYEPADSRFEHRVKWFSYWEIMMDFQESRIVHPAQEALAAVPYTVRGEFVECPVCFRTDLHFGANIVHKPDCQLVKARAAVAALEVAS